LPAKILVMFLFKKKAKSIVGVDIGTASVKVVELIRQNNAPKLVTYGLSEQSADIVRDSSPEASEKVARILKAVIDKARVSGRTAMAALPTFSVFSSILSLPAVSKADLPQAIKWEAKKFVPMPLEEMNLDWHVLQSDSPVQQVNDKEPAADKQSAADQNKEGSSPRLAKLNRNNQVNHGSRSGRQKAGNIRVLITAAPKSLVNRYFNIFQKAGLQLVSLETEAFALARALFPGEKSVFMIVDIGSITTDICIIERGIPILNRSIDVGGLNITKALSRSLNVNQQRAEQFKRDIGISQASSHAGIPKIIEQSLSPVINEIKYSLNLFQSQSNQEVKKVVLVGGSSSLPNLDIYLSTILNLKVFLGNPWSVISYPEELKPVLDEVGPRLAVAIGLAARDI